MPKPPTPKTATVSPGWRRALLMAWSDVAEEHIITAPCAKGISSGSTKALRAGIAMYSA